MKNVKLEKSGDAITVSTPHGKVTIYVLGGPTVGEKGWNFNETKVEVKALQDGEHFYQIGNSEAPVIDPPVPVDLFPIKIRMRNVSHIRVNEANEGSPLRPLFMKILHSGQKEEKKK